MNKLSSIIKATLSATAKAKQGLLENIIIDDSADNVLITVINSQFVSVSNEGAVTMSELVEKTTIQLDFSTELEVKLSAAVMSLMLDGMRALKAVKGNYDVKVLEKSNIAARFLAEVLPVATGKIAVAEKPIVTLSDSIPVTDALLAEYGLTLDDVVIEHCKVQQQFGQPCLKAILKDSSKVKAVYPFIAEDSDGIPVPAKKHEHGFLVWLVAKA